MLTDADGNMKLKFSREGSIVIVDEGCDEIM
jgi:hypothetical protein